LEVELARIEQLKNDFLILEMGEKAAETYGKLLSRLEKTGKKNF
jgi:predicted nucleic acid-binding protein